LASRKSRDPKSLSREGGERLTTIEANVRGRDIGGFVAEAQQAADRELKLPGDIAFSGEVCGSIWRVGGIA